MNQVASAKTRVTRFGVYPLDRRAFMMKQELEQNTVWRNVGLLSQTANQPELAVALIIRNQQGKMLLVKSHRWNNLYMLPRGRVRHGEKAEEAVKRMAYEGTSLHVDEARYFGVFEYVQEEEHVEQRGQFVGLLYLCKTGGSEVRLDDNAEEFAWVSPSEALKLPLVPALRSLIFSLPRTFSSL